MNQVLSKLVAALRYRAELLFAQGELLTGMRQRRDEDLGLFRHTDARLLGGLVGGTRAYEQARADQREAAVPDDMDRQAVLEADEHGVVTRG